MQAAMAAEVRHWEGVEPPLELADHLELVWELLAAGADVTKADKVRGAQQMGISR